MRSRTPGTKLFLLGALAILTLLIHLNVGSTFWYTPWGILREILHGPGGEGANLIVWQFRMPRAIASLLVGGTLGIVGSAFQAQFRNPLAEPYVIGVSSGAAVGGVIAMLTGVDAALAGLGTTLFGFIGGILSLLLVLGLARRRGVIDVNSLLLAGVVIGSFLAAVLSMTLLGSGQNSNEVLGWMMGNMINVVWQKVGVLAVVLAIGAVVLVRQTRRLNALALGEEAAARLGVDVGRLRMIVLATGTAMTAAAVGTVGIIAFLGLVAPHIARRVVGVDWRWSLAASGLVGSSLLIASDLVAQRGLSLITHTPGLEVPVGVVTAVLGAPTLLILLRSDQKV